MTTATAAKKEKKFRGIVVINHDNCKGCAFCVEFCPTKALELEKGFNAIGLDIDARKADALMKGESYIKHIPASRIRKAVDQVS